MNAVIGFSSALRQGLAGPLNQKQEEFADYISSGGKHLLALITDILDLSKIESGKMTLTMEPTDVHALLVSSLSVVRERALAHQLHLHLDAQPRDWVMADQRKTKQIVYNLLSNAVKFTPDGGNVTMRLQEIARSGIAAQALFGNDDGTGDPEDRFLAISVTDTGIGIAHDDLQRLFQPFVQLDSGLTRKYEGTGLGLALVRQLVELHGGCLSVNSRLGEGSTFCVWLPLLTAPEQPTTSCP